MFLSLNTSGHKFSVISTTTSSMMFNSMSDSSLPLLSDINYSSVISMYSTTKSSMMFNSMSHSSLSFWHQLFLIDFYNQVFHDVSFHVRFFLAFTFWYQLFLTVYSVSDSSVSFHLLSDSPVICFFICDRFIHDFYVFFRYICYI